MDKSDGCPGNAAVIEKGPRSAQGASETILPLTCISVIKAVLSSHGPGKAQTGNMGTH